MRLPHPLSAAEHRAPCVKNGAALGCRERTGFIWEPMSLLEMRKMLPWPCAGLGTGSACCSCHRGGMGGLDPSSALESLHEADLVRNFTETTKEGFASAHGTSPSPMKQTLPYILFWARPIPRGKLSQIAAFKENFLQTHRMSYYTDSQIKG